MALILVLLTLMRTFTLASLATSLVIRLTKTRRPGTVLRVVPESRSSHQPRATTPFKSPSFLLSALSWRFRMTCPTAMSTPFSSLAATTMSPWRTEPGSAGSYLSPRAALQLIFTDSFIMSELQRSRIVCELITSKKATDGIATMRRRTDIVDLTFCLQTDLQNLAMEYSNFCFACLFYVFFSRWPLPLTPLPLFDKRR